MKVKETLHIMEPELLFFNGEPCGVFADLFEQGDLLYKYRAEFSKGYYFAHSANKTVSPYYEHILTINGLEDTLRANTAIASILRSKFNHKWEKIYTALYEEYSPISNFRYDEQGLKDYKGDKHTDSRDNNENHYDNTTTDTLTEKKTENNSSSYEENKSEYVAYKITEKTNQDSTVNSVWGFNSNEPTNLDKSDNTFESVSQRNRDDNKVENHVENNTTNNDIYDINSSREKNDTNTHNLHREFDQDENQNYKETYTKNKSGRDTSAQSLINEEIELRVKHIIEDIIYKDIDSILTLPIYI